MRKILITSGIACLLLTGCASTGGPNETAGTVGGAVVGGLIGNAIAPRGPGGAIVGALVGGVVGNAIGRDLDEQARREAYEAEEYAFQYDRPREWVSGGGKYRGRVVPRRVYVDNGRQCRQYEHTIYINERPRTATGVACRQANGTWKTVT